MRILFAFLCATFLLPALAAAQQSPVNVDVPYVPTPNKDRDGNADYGGRHQG